MIPSSRLLSAARSRSAFLLLDLLAVLAIVSLLLGVFQHTLSKARESGYITIDLGNFRQILEASALYANENDDHLAHPTWDGDLTGPDGWAYLTSSRFKKVPGALSFTPGSCTGWDIDSKVFTNQLAFFRAAQIGQYLPSVCPAWCPKDISTRSSGLLHGLWLGRPVKVTSYAWNGTIGGYGSPQPNTLLSGRTYKLSQFRPGDWQMWEKNENVPLAFEHAAAHPLLAVEGLTFRHSAAPNWWRIPADTRNVPGSAVVGTFDGSAQPMRTSLAYDLRHNLQNGPNPLLNGPAFSP